jgi:hypothetical protein
MILTAAYLSSILSCHYRSGPGATPFCRRHPYARFYPLRERQDQRYLLATNSRVAFPVPAAQRLLDPRLQPSIQIPIAHLSTLTAVALPAVSSLGAYQTPAP